MYSNYINYIQSINKDNIFHIPFKSSSQYNAILEHVSIEQGNQYLSLIENEFHYISHENINNFVKINDKLGFPNTYNFKFKNGDNLNSSPTTLRYIYHSLLILQYFKNTNLLSMVEIGCGYGGLFIAICYFSKLLNINIENYYIIDFPEVCTLIDNYLKLNSEIINIKYSLHNCNEYGINIAEENLFLISNYCFTEISEEHRNNYISKAFNKIKNGFILWQTVFSLGIDKLNIINKNIEKVIEERPQTASQEHKNYFIYF